MRLELEDLPLRYRAQAEKQLAERKHKTEDTLEEKAKQAKTAEKEFDSEGEYDFYMGTVLPQMAAGKIAACEQHPRFALFDKSEYGNVKLGAIRYTADFMLHYTDGTVEVVEIKSKFVRRMQRDYPIRRRIFIENIAKPNRWKFTEIITAETKEEYERWQEIAKER